MNLPGVCSVVGVTVCDSTDSVVYLMVSVCRRVLLSLAGCVREGGVGGAEVEEGLGCPGATVRAR